MNYIVDPWWVYWFFALPRLGTAAVVIMPLSIVVAIIFVITYFCTLEDARYKHINTMSVKWLKASCIVVAVSVFMSIAVPDKDTMLYIQVSKFATVENVDTTVDAAKDFVDYISDTIIKIQNADE